MDLETLIITVYVLVDDWYKQEIAPYCQHHQGAAAKMSDSEVLTLAIAGQFRVGVPWQSERGLVRYVHHHLLYLFPHMLERSAFNSRVRYLWGVLIRLQVLVAEKLLSADDLYECIDCEPLPAYTSGQASRERGHWLWESTIGKGGNSRGFFYGDHVLVSVTSRGVITGWLTASAYIQDRWLLEAFLSVRAGNPQLRGPDYSPHQAYNERVPPPVGHIGPCQASGHATGRPYVADKGFNGQRWLNHWSLRYQAVVISPPHQSLPDAWSSADEGWLASHRQPIETAFALLDEVFLLNRLNAHSRWGQYTRLAAKTLAYNIGIFINHMLNRPLLALATLIC